MNFLFTLLAITEKDVEALALFFVIAIFGAIFLFVCGRDIACWFIKTNEIVAKQDEIVAKQDLILSSLKEIDQRLHGD